MSDMFVEREVVEDAADRWWIFLLTGIAWLVFALIVFQWDYTTVSAISYLFGVVAIIAGVNEFLEIPISTTGWKWVHALLGVLFIAVGIYALLHPYDTFQTLAALIGLFLLFKGIFDITVAFVTKERVRAVVAPARDRPHRDHARVLGRRELPREGDPARGLRRDHRALARDQRDLRRVQAEGRSRRPPRGEPDASPEFEAVRRV